jgi:hypothetical protein
VAFEFDEWIDDSVAAYENEDYMASVSASLIAIAYLFNDISLVPEEDSYGESDTGPFLDFGDGSAGS